MKSFWSALTPAFLLVMGSSLTKGLSTPSTGAKTYDLLVIGGGSAGLTAAKIASNTIGNSVLLIEKAKYGGDCTFYGCVPSKTLLACSREAHAATKRHIVHDKSPKIDFEAVKKRIRDTIDTIYTEDDSPEALSKFGVETLVGTATLKSKDTVEVSVDGESQPMCFQAKEGIILCTGASASTPPIDGIDQVDYVTYEEVWDLKELPKKLTIVGGGPIGCEIAQAFSRLGSKVTIVSSTLLKREEPEVDKTLREIFADEGITVVSGRVSKVAKEGNGHKATCSLSDGTEQEITGDQILVAAGRSPNAKGMGLEEIGIELKENGGIKVNEKLQTSVSGIYAAGDCTGDFQFTHYAGFQGGIAARNILLPLTDVGVIKDVPSATFTSPEISSVGLREAQARETLGDQVGVAFKKLEHMDRALCDGQTKGFIKVLYRKKSGKILGATVMAPSAGELISEIHVAMKAGMPFHKLTNVMHPYPSYAMELQLMASDLYYEKTMSLKPVYNVLKKLGL